MISDESSSCTAVEKDFRANRAITKNSSTPAILNNKEFKSKPRSIECERQTSSSTSNFRLSRSKYAKLIDQTDIKWWTDIQEQRLAAGKEFGVQSKETDSANIKEKVCKNEFSYEPINCPMSDCQICFMPNDMMLHFLSFHRQKTRIYRLREKQRFLISLKPFELNVDEVNCLGLISFVGTKTASDDGNVWLPQNLNLCRNYEPLEHDYTIFMLASIVPMDIFIKPKAEADSNSICASMLVVWLAGAHRNTKIFYTVSGFNEELSNSRSGIYDVRLLTTSQCPYDFCNKDCNYFRLTFKELYLLLKNEKILNIEFECHEHFENEDE